MADPIASLFIDIRAGLEKLQGDMNSAVGVVEGASKKIESIGKNIQKIFQGALVVTGVVAVKKLGEAIVGLEQHLVSLAQKGNQAEGLARSFEMLGGNAASIDAASAAIKGLVAQGDLLRTANEGLVREIPGLNENFAELAELGAKVGIATGKTAKEGIEGLMGALESGKTKQLQAYGILVDSTKAYEAYAGGLKNAEKVLSDTEKRQAVAIAAQAQFGDALKKLPPLQDSVTVSNTRMANAFDDLWEEVGKVVDKNPDLIRGFERLEQLFTDPQFISNIASIADGIATLTGNLVGAAVAATDLASRLGGLPLTALEALSGPAPKYRRPLTDTGIVDALSGRTAVTDRGIVEALGRNTKFTAPTGPYGPEAPDWLRRKIQADAEEQVRDAERLRDKIKGIADEWQKIAVAGEKKGIDDQIKDAIEALDGTSFQSAVGKMGDVLDKELSEKVADAIAKGYKPNAEQIAAAKEGIDATLDQYQEQFAKASEQNAKKLADDQRRAFEESVNFFGDIFDQIINGSADNMKEVFERVLKQIAVGFASQLAAELTGGFSIKGGAGGFGQMIASSIFGSGGLGLFGSAGGGVADIKQGAIDAAKGLASVGETAASTTSVFSQLSANMGSFATALPTIAGAIGAVAVAAGTIKGVQSIAGGKKLSAGEQAALALPTFGTSFLYNPVMGMLGGGKNPDTIARKQIESYLEEKLGRNVQFGGAGRFNKPGWADSFNSTQNSGAFLGFGNALQDMLGITQEVGPQVAAILSDNLGGSLTELGKLIDDLGLNFEEVTQSIIQNGLEAGKSWLEIEGSIAGAEGAFGQTAKGAKTLADAFGVLASSEGKGMGAVEALRRMAELAKEGGGKTIEDLKRLMEAQNIGTTDQRNDLFAGLAQRGVTNLDQLATASDRTAGAVIADITAMGFEWSKVADEIERARVAQEGFNASAGVAPVPATGAPGAVETHARGGVVHSPTYFASRGRMHVMGEAGPEAILPLTRVNGRLGVAAADGGGGGRGDIHINVSAPYSAPGQEYAIEDAVRRGAEAALDALAQGMQSGGMRGMFGG